MMFDLLILYFVIGLILTLTPLAFMSRQEHRDRWKSFTEVVGNDKDAFVAMHLFAITAWPLILLIKLGKKL
ncbi:hypothetical protein SEA_GODONK_223 [Gordonia phage GodonK]|uniref:Uncharacterized protein n=1 Tax=Gordonia phage GodonK TaxID=2562192 RepID=A0A4D6E2S4_9CAUD|nr:hypothetical protein HOV33_gp145 [Gordonia phage GodonK]QBZ72811.1 hypothetical protein SEA_GODONK_223 [Gordonia phage GodonK]